MCQVASQKQPPEVFCEKGVLRNFTKFTGKHLHRLSFLIRLQASACKETLAQVFSSQFPEIFDNTFSCRTPPVAASDKCQHVANLTFNVIKLFISKSKYFVKFFFTIFIKALYIKSISQSFSSIMYQSRSEQLHRLRRSYHVNVHSL